MFSMSKCVHGAVQVKACHVTGRRAIGVRRPVVTRGPSLIKAKAREAKPSVDYHEPKYGSGKQGIPVMNAIPSCQAAVLNGMWRHT